MHPAHAHVSQSLAIVHPIMLSHGCNAEVWDDSGKRYIDFVGGIGVLNLGHCHPRIVEAVREQAGRLTHSAFNALPHQGYGQFMDALARFVPLSYPLCGMLTNSGAEATENALKIVRAATGRCAVVAFDGGFHGRTLAALNLNGKVAPYKQKLGSLPGPVYHLPYPSADNEVSVEQAMVAMQRLFSVEIDAADVGCIVVEAVQGEAGFQALDVGFAQHLRRFCNANGIVLILDEIQSGFGRTGQRFAFSRLGIEPDLLLLGKSMAGGLPLGAVVGRKALLDALPKGGLGGTYSGNPLACAAGLATLELMSDANLATWGERQEQCILKHYQRWQDSELAPALARLTGVGAMRGIELRAADGGPGSERLSRLLNAAREAGLLLMPSGKYRHIIRLLAPLTAEAELLDEGFAIFSRCLQASL